MLMVCEICVSKEVLVKFINVMIMGIFNVGKLILINIFVECIIVKIGNEFVVIKSQQCINLGSGIVLFDILGVLWLKLENFNFIYCLVVFGVVKNIVMEFDDVGFYVVDYLIKVYLDFMQECFKLDEILLIEFEFLEVVVKKCGVIMSGGWVNLYKICEIFLIEL